MILGDRAPVPCDIGDAHGVAMAFMEKGTTVTPLPFRQPELLDKQIRINVSHAGMCQSDIFNVTQGWAEHGMFPMVPGHEICGVVDKVGEKVTHFKEGDRVGFGVFSDCCDNCKPCRTGHDQLCDKRAETYGPEFGGYSTSFQSRGDFFYKLDDSFQGEWAPLFCAGVTTHAPLVRYARPGMKVGIVGIGGLGHLGIFYAKSFGCEVTAISTTASKEQEAYNLGAHHFIHSRDPESLKKNAKSLDLILDTGSGMNLSMDFGLLRPGGSVAVVGVPNSSEDCQLNILQLIMNQQELHGSQVGSRLSVEDMLEYTRVSGVHPIVEVYPFSDTQAAVNSLAHGNPHFPKYRNVLETASFFKTFTPNRN